MAEKKVKTLPPLPDKKTDEPVASEKNFGGRDSWSVRLDCDVADIMKGEVPDRVLKGSYGFDDFKRYVESLPDNLGELIRDDPDWFAHTDSVFDSDWLTSQDGNVDCLCSSIIGRDALKVAYPGVDIYGTGLSEKFEEYLESMTHYEAMTELYGKLQVECPLEEPAAPKGYEDSFSQVYADYKLRNEIYGSYRTEQLTGTPGPISEGNPYVDSYNKMAELQSYSKETVSNAFASVSESDTRSIGSRIFDSVMEQHPILKFIYEKIQEYTEAGHSLFDKVKDTLYPNLSGFSDDLADKRYNEARSELHTDDIGANGAKTKETGLTSP